MSLSQLTVRLSWLAETLEHDRAFISVISSIKNVLNNQ